MFTASILVRNLFANLHGVRISRRIQVFASVSVPKQLFNAEQRSNRLCGFLFIRDTVHFACRRFLAFCRTDRSTRMHVEDRLRRSRFSSREPSWRVIENERAAGEKGKKRGWFRVKKIVNVQIQVARKHAPLNS